MTPNDDLLRVARPMLKGWVRQTRTLLAVLSQLDAELDAVVDARLMRTLDERMAEEAKRNGTTTNGSPRAHVTLRQ